MRKRIYMTRKHQTWTFGDRDDLRPYLDGEDDEILEYAVLNREFTIILKNGLTYDVVDSEKEAIDAITYIYRNYQIVKNTGKKCYIARDNVSKKYLTLAAAQNADCYDCVYVPDGKYYLAKFGKILSVGATEEEMTDKMYAHYKAKYTYMS